MGDFDRGNEIVMGKLIFITGGARSGKSQHATELAKKIGDKVAFIATCVPLDAEMKNRVEQHRRSRPKGWKTIEAPIKVASALKNLNRFDAVIIDCITLFLTNLMLNEMSDERIFSEITNLVQTAKEVNFVTIIVSNEVGSGIVPPSEMGRRFRDLAGFANQIIAQNADEVYLMVSGIPVKVK